MNPVRQTTTEIPVVFIATNDPVGLGIVRSLSHPGGKLTGFTLYEVTMVASWWSFSRSRRRTLGGWPSSTTRTTAARSSTGGLSRRSQNRRELLPVSFPVHDATSIEEAIDAFAREPNGGLAPDGPDDCAIAI